MQNHVTTTDLYESAYYLIKGAELVEIESRTVNGRISCELTFAKPNIIQLQIDYYQGKAEANLIELRRVFGQLHAWVHTAKKKFKNKLKTQEEYAQEQGGA